MFKVDDVLNRKEQVLTYPKQVKLEEIRDESYVFLVTIPNSGYSEGDTLILNKELAEKIYGF